MSKHHKGGNHGTKWSSGSSRPAKTEVPAAGNITQPRNFKETSADRQGRNPVTSELKHHHESCVDGNKGDGWWQQTGSPDENWNQPESRDANGEKEQASSASCPVADQASGTQMEHSAQSEYEELPADSSVTTASGMSFLCKCLECQHENPILKEMVYTHPKKDYYIGLLRQQHAHHEAKCSVVSEGAELKTPQQKNCDIQAVSDCSSAKNQPSSSFPVGVSRFHGLLLIRVTKSPGFMSPWLLKLCCVGIFSNIVIKSCGLKLENVSVLVHNMKVSKKLEAILFPTFDKITQQPLDIPYLCTKSALLLIVFSIIVHTFMVHVKIKCFHTGFKPPPAID